MIERYQGDEGRRLLIEAIRAQTFVEGNEALAAELADAAFLEEVLPGQHLMEQEGIDNDIVLIVSGLTKVLINKREIALRRTGQHVGEMAMIDPSARRSATVAASEQSVVARIPESKFAEIAERYPRVWRLLAVEIARRLRERNRFIRLPNDKPRVFIGSSREALAVAKNIQDGLSGQDFEIRLWTSGVFGASKTAIEALDEVFDTLDFAVIVFSGDDKVLSRDTEQMAPRDNVVFELGLSIGALSRARSFIVLPHGADLKIPTDLLGVTSIRYAPDDPPALSDRLAPVCRELTEAIVAQGPK